MLLFTLCCSKNTNLFPCSDCLAEWRLMVQRCGSAVFLRQTQHPVTNFGLIGRQFETRCTIEHSSSAAFDFCTVISLNIGNHHVLLGAEIDCVDEQTRVRVFFVVSVFVFSNCTFNSPFVINSFFFHIGFKSTLKSKQPNCLRQQPLVPLQLLTSCSRWLPSNGFGPKCFLVKSTNW